MSYKIAVGSSDGIHVDLKFGEVTKFLIYEVTDEIKLCEERDVGDEEERLNREVTQNNEGISCVAVKCNSERCSGHGGGCQGASDVISKVSLISDCRCVVCKKIGFQAQKHFEKKAISVFDVECEIKEALDKITYYYSKIDKHEPYRK